MRESESIAGVLFGGLEGEKPEIDGTSREGDIRAVELGSSRESKKWAPIACRRIDIICLTVHDNERIVVSERISRKPKATTRPSNVSATTGLRSNATPLRWMNG